MRQYRDPQSRELKKLSANQFMEVWSHYDKDGELVIFPFVIPNKRCLSCETFFANYS
ncbi:Calbindin-32 [Blattella germanica]|nr:Calbindin-32 [Blattella germanica]